MKPKHTGALKQAVSNRCEEEVQRAKENDRMLVSRGSSGSCMQELFVATAADFPLLSLSKHHTATLSSGYFLLLSLICFPWLVVLRCCSRRFCTQPVKGYGRGKNLSPSASRGKYGFRQKTGGTPVTRSGSIGIRIIRILTPACLFFCQWTSEQTPPPPRQALQASVVVATGFCQNRGTSRL